MVSYASNLFIKQRILYGIIVKVNSAIRQDTTQYDYNIRGMQTSIENRHFSERCTMAKMCLLAVVLATAETLRQRLYRTAIRQ